VTIRITGGGYEYAEAPLPTGCFASRCDGTREFGYLDI
jgi:hypothetical protein